VEEGSAHGLAEVRLEALVVGVRHESDAGGEEFWARGLDVDVTRAIGLVEREAVVRGLLLAVLELCLRDRRAEVDIPERGGQSLVSLAALMVADEPELALADGLVGDRAVGLRPVDAEAELTEDVFELLLVFDGELLAQFDEVAAADRLLVSGLQALRVAFEGRRE